jgi:hypothetical protein
MPRETPDPFPGSSLAHCDFTGPCILPARRGSGAARRAVSRRPVRAAARGTRRRR